MLNMRFSVRFDPDPTAPKIPFWLELAGLVVLIILSAMILPRAILLAWWSPILGGILFYLVNRQLIRLARWVAQRRRGL